jgi:hypothetical protein
MVNGALSTIRSVIASFVLIGVQRYKAGLAKAGIGIDAFAVRLQDKGAACFAKSSTDLMACINSKSAMIGKAS